MPTSAALPVRRIGPFDVTAIGLGCMNLSHAYGPPTDRALAEAVLHKTLDLGVTFLDTASAYGMGHNETLIGETLKARRHEFTLASKCGLGAGPDGRVIDGSPANIRKVLEGSLRRLQTETIDLYYLHRLDRTVPIEDSVGALADAAAAGKIRGIGLSEISAQTLRRAQAVHPIAAVQSEYSLWTRNPEIAVLDACRELGVGFVAFSPLGRGFLTGRIRSADDLHATDFRRGVPRVQGEAWQANLKLIEALAGIAAEAGCTAGQLALAWVLAQGDHIAAIPGTTKLDHLAEDVASADVRLDAAILKRAGDLINQHTVKGARYPAAAQADIDTEEFAG
jgi:aryl-alcohol dehydrogenase-like predicted oxidoreductase